MQLAFLEKLTLRETGRSALPINRRRKRQLMIFPEALAYRQALLEPYAEGQPMPYYVSYGGRGGRTGWKLIGFMLSLLRLLPVSNRIGLFMFSYHRDMRYIRPAAALARLLGVPITLHDYSYRPAPVPKSMDRLYSLCGCVEVGDGSVLESGENVPLGLVCRTGRWDRDQYAVAAKSSAVPVVAVCGDFESRKIFSLARRAHDLIKQKYPRTDFLLISPVDENETVSAHGDECGSFRLMAPISDNDVRDLFDRVDMLMILSPGGLNRDWLVRAMAAGYPVIVNGSAIAEAGDGIIAVPHDSYTRLAEAVIRLVDDDEYYRGFARQRD